MNLIKKLDTILSANIPLSRMKNMSRLANGTGWQNISDIEIDPVGLKYNKDSAKKQIFSFIPEEFEGIQHLFSYDLIPIDQYRHKEIVTVLNKVENRISELEQKMRSALVELDEFVFSSIIDSLNKKYSLQIPSIKYLKNYQLLRKMGFADARIQHKIPLPYFFNDYYNKELSIKLKEFLDYPCGIKDADALEIQDEIVLPIVNSAKATDLTNQLLQDKNEFDSLFETGNKIEYWLSKYNQHTVKLGIEPNNVYAAYDKWFEAETGNSKAKRIAPKELSNENTYVVISRSIVDIANELNKSVGKNYTDMLYKMINTAGMSGSLIAIVCERNKNKSLNYSRPKISSPVSYYFIFPKITMDEKDRRQQEKDLFLDPNKPNWWLICEEPNFFLSIRLDPEILSKVQDYLDLHWNNKIGAKPDILRSAFDILS